MCKECNRRGRSTKADMRVKGKINDGSDKFLPYQGWICEDCKREAEILGAELKVTHRTGQYVRREIEGIIARHLPHTTLDQLVAQGDPTIRGFAGAEKVARYVRLKKKA